jgi:hypothetical protein
MKSEKMNEKIPNKNAILWTKKNVQFRVREFCKNPSADNYSGLEFSMLVYQECVKTGASIGMAQMSAETFIRRRNTHAVIGLLA